MALTIWRHPKPINALGICLGHTDLPVDPRRIRRLSDRIQRTAKEQQLPRVIHVSPLQRSRRVGETLAKKGWVMHIDPELIEFNFGHWDGLPWDRIDRSEMDHWCNHFADFAPGGGENLQQLFARVKNWIDTHSGQPRLVVGHAGWITAARMIHEGKPLPASPSDWSLSISYGKKTAF